LFKRKITDDLLCPMCQLKVEIVSHALWSCHAAQDVWLVGNARIPKSYSKENTFSNTLLRLFDRLSLKDFELVTSVARQILLK
jgi:hypothetical protein